MDPRGAHSLACRKSAGRQTRHAAVNEVVARAFTRAGIPCTKEPTGLIPGSSLRPDGVTIIPGMAVCKAMAVFVHVFVKMAVLKRSMPVPMRMQVPV